MTPQDNIRWYWDDLSTNEKIYLLSELYGDTTYSDRDRFLKRIENL